MTPQRIQRKRTKGWRKPEGAIYVGRGSRWGNPFKVVPVAGGYEVHKGDLRLGPYATREDANRRAIAGFRVVVVNNLKRNPRHYEPLRGKILMCFCPEFDEDGNPAMCHADVLLEVANQEAPQ